MQQVMFLKAHMSKHNVKTTRERRTMSSSASGTSGAEPIGGGLVSGSDEMKVLKQYPGNLLKFFLQTKRELAEAMVSLTAVGRASDQQM